jgi:type IV pilus assembly protein PilP
MDKSKYFRYLQSSLIVSIAVVLASCGSAQQRDLEDFVATTKAEYKGSVPPLPVPKPYVIYVYQGKDKGLRDPFIEEVAQRDEDEFQTELGPDSTRTHEPLEAYPKDALRFVGSMKSKDNTVWALIHDPDGILHRVREGNHLGEAYGRIITVSESEITLVEKYVDGSHGWKERTVSFGLSDDN